jgi:lipopolysaccharide assembly outer membrane protein LptD (OstA)
MKLAVFAILFLFSCSSLFGEGTEAEPTTEFRAKEFTQDLRTKKRIGKGKAYLKQVGKEVWADEIEFDLVENKIIAVGDVHIREKGVDIFCARGVYSMRDDTATLEEATLVSGQMVISGMTIHKLAKDRFDMVEGFYTNCNNDLVKDKTAASCLFDWKIYGRKFDITIEGYFHVWDAIIYGKDMPAVYMPYYLAPAKTKRASGFLLATVGAVDDLGTGVRTPYFLVLGPWHDITITPTPYSKGGTHLGLEYRYIYSVDKQGSANLFMTSRSITPDRAKPREKNTEKAKTLGVIGEFAVDINNVYQLGERSHAHLNFLYVSDPYYPRLYPRDLNAKGDLAYLRSQLALTFPSDDYLFTGAGVYHQSLILTKTPPDQERDRGAVGQLPALKASKKAEPFLSQFFSYEVDTQFSNYLRSGRAWDSTEFTLLPRSKETPGRILNPNYQDGDLIREGRRLQIEPKLVGNLPLGSGFQFQPTLKVGELLYHFDLPNSTFVRREYVDINVPFSMYLSKNFETGISGFEEIKHVFQPRASYASALYRSPQPTHPFFRRPLEPNNDEISSPRFDLVDNVTNFEYMRIDISNRLLRKVDDSSERFLLLDLGNQYNLRTDPYDRRYSGKLGPLDILMAINIWRLAIGVQGAYQLEKTKFPKDAPMREIHESDWTIGINYAGDGTSLTVSSTLKNRANPAEEEQTINSSFSTNLPLYLTTGGGIEYSAKKGELRSYNFNLGFAQQPARCWTLNFGFSHGADGINTAAFTFAFLLGGPLSYTGS